MKNIKWLEQENKTVAEKNGYKIEITYNGWSYEMVAKNRKGEQIGSKGESISKSMLQAKAEAWLGKL